MDEKEKNTLHIKNWPERDRPREMLLEKGPESLSDAALLAILLRTGRKGQDAVALGREMLARFGGFSGLISARYKDLIDVKGIGKAKIAQILAAMEIAKRQLRQPLEKVNVIKNPRALFDYLSVSMGDLTREEFRLLHLNRSKHLIGEDVLFRGTVDASAVYTREVIESALRKKASALIFAHNHPTAPAEASPEDIELTAALVTACRTVDIPVLDHVIIGQGGFFSLRQELPEMFTGDDRSA
ncbi:MAG: DNA repair protein RadC [Desulfobacterales bacterium]|nr:DNA repair protein RadC [Desulfobacterales bacterium]